MLPSSDRPRVKVHAAVLHSASSSPGTDSDVPSVGSLGFSGELMLPSATESFAQPAPICDEADCDEADRPDSAMLTQRSSSLQSDSTGEGQASTIPASNITFSPSGSDNARNERGLTLQIPPIALFSLQPELSRMSSTAIRSPGSLTPQQHIEQPQRNTTSDKVANATEPAHSRQNPQSQTSRTTDSYSSPDPKHEPWCKPEPNAAAAAAAAAHSLQKTTASSYEDINLSEANCIVQTAEASSFGTVNSATSKPALSDKSLSPRTSSATFATKPSFRGSCDRKQTFEDHMLSLQAMGRMEDAIHLHSRSYDPSCFKLRRALPFYVFCKP
jgi:hypothetical protein